MLVKCGYIIYYIHLIMHDSTEIIQKLAFLKNCFMHFFVQIWSSNSIRTISLTVLLLVMFLSQIFLAMKNMMRVDLPILTDIGKNQ